MTDDSIRYDAVTVHNRAQFTPEGFLRDTPVIARAGVQEYRRADGSTRREYRPPEVVFAAQSLAAIAGIPIIDRHSALINATNARQHVVGSVVGQARQDSANPNHMVGDIVIYDPTPITKHGRKELSLAYGVRCDETPGTTPDGQPYDAMVVAITRYDHLAIVEKGRAGVAKLRLDAADAISAELSDIEISNEDGNMPGENEPNVTSSDPASNTPKPPAVTPPASGASRMAVIRLDGIEYQAPPEVERALVRANEAVTAAKLRADQAEAARDTLQASIAEYDAKIVQARADGATAARARLQLESVAQEHGVEVRADATDRVIRETVIKKLNNKPDMNFDGKSDDYVGFAFDAAIERAAEAAKNNRQNRVAVNGGVVSPAAAVRADGQQVPAPLGPPTIRSAAQAREFAQRRARAI